MNDDSIFLFPYVLLISSRVAQWKRAGPITQRSEDQNLALLIIFFWKTQVLNSSKLSLLNGTELFGRDSTFFSFAKGYKHKWSWISIHKYSKVKWASLRLNVLIQKAQISESKAKLKVMREWRSTLFFPDLLPISSRVAQWKRAGPITQRSEDQNLALLTNLLFA